MKEDEAMYHYVLSYFMVELGWQHILAIMLKDKEKDDVFGWFLHCLYLRGKYLYNWHKVDFVHWAKDPQPTYWRDKNQVS